MSIYTIYKATNTANHKSYIGFDSHWPNRMRQHLREANPKTKFHKSLLLHGSASFEWEIIYQSWDAIHCLNIMEPFFIREFDSAQNGYNSSLGGEGSIGCFWWNNGIGQSFSAFPPDSSYIRGRLPFNNVGSKIGSGIQKKQYWTNNGKVEKMVPRDSPLEEGFAPGRLKHKAFGGTKRGHITGTFWWNNGEIQIMSKICPGGEFIRGRINHTNKSKKATQKYLKRKDDYLNSHT